MSAKSVDDIWADLKTQTRRVVKPFKLTGKKMGEVTRVWALPNDPCGFACRYVYGKPPRSEGYAESPIRCPYGVPGDLLWVRETWAAQPCYDNLKPNDIPEGGARTDLLYECGPSQRIVDGYHLRRKARHMPRWAARLWLRVVMVGVERVQDITDEDAIAEGIERCTWCDQSGKYEHPDYQTIEKCPECYGAIAAFASLWNTLNAKRGFSWDSNPWVWVIGFERVTSAISDQHKETT